MLRAIVIWAASLITFVVVATIGPATAWAIGHVSQSPTGGLVVISVFAAMAAAPMTACFLDKRIERSR